MADYVMSKVIIRGDSDALGALRSQHLSSGSFDFNTVEPGPEDLNIGESSASETGYQALYGDWTQPAEAWTWKAAATKLGYPFPLESREQVVACIRSYENPGFYFDGAEQYKRNYDKYGHFTSYDWCAEHWGTKTNAEECTVKELAGAIEIRFVTAWAFPTPVFVAVSKAFPALEFEILSLDEIGGEPDGYVMQNGVRVKTVQVSKRQARKTLSQ